MIVNIAADSRATSSRFASSGGSASAQTKTMPEAAPSTPVQKTTQAPGISSIAGTPAVIVAPASTNGQRWPTNQLGATAIKTETGSWAALKTASAGITRVGLAVAWR